MQKELLYKYFRAETSPTENKKILDWVEASNENHNTFITERKLWEMTLMANIPNQTTENETVNFVKKTKTSLFGRVAGVAAIFIVAITGMWFGLTRLSPAGELIVTVPTGQRVNVKLADGTNVWLNSNSTLRYSSDFNNKNRNVKLDGEAYFEVTSQKGKPFVVTAGNFNVEVLGTKFNVYAYNSTNRFLTSVNEGIVKVSGNKETITLKQNEAVQLHDNKLQKIKTDNDNDWWERGILSFQDEPIADVMNRLSAYYDKKISIEFSENSDYRCTAKFLYNDGLDYILKVIQKDVRYKILTNPDSSITLK